jgi:pimeloyl-ACP methyl ester carboxylesterase
LTVKAALWEDPLPPTPTLPTPTTTGLVHISKGVDIWYASYWSTTIHYRPKNTVIFLHGGMGNSNYFANQVKVLIARKTDRVVLIDSRGHGRSSRSHFIQYSYDLMASDVIAVMDHLDITKASIVGWSDGANVGLLLAINYSDRVVSLFAQAANTNPEAVNIDNINASPVFNQYFETAAAEYLALSPTPTTTAEWEAFLIAIGQMWASEPAITIEQLEGITVRTWIVVGDHDEAIFRENTFLQADSIPNAGLLIQPEVSHFSFIQDPEQYTEDVLHFLGQSACSPSKCIEKCS